MSLEAISIDRYSLIIKEIDSKGTYSSSHFTIWNEKAPIFFLCFWSCIILFDLFIIFIKLNKISSYLFTFINDNLNEEFLFVFMWVHLLLNTYFFLSNSKQKDNHYLLCICHICLNHSNFMLLLHSLSSLYSSFV